MTELDEVAATFRPDSTITTLREATNIIRRHLPDETPAVIDGVAEAYLRQCKAAAKGQF